MEKDCVNQIRLEPMFRPFETLSQYGCQMFPYLEYLLLCLSISYFSKVFDSLSRLFELVTLQG